MRLLKFDGTTLSSFTSFGLKDISLSSKSCRNTILWQSQNLQSNLYMQKCKALMEFRLDAKNALKFEPIMHFYTLYNYNDLLIYAKYKSSSNLSFCTYTYKCFNFKCVFQSLSPTSTFGPSYVDTKKTLWFFCRYLSEINITIHIHS